MKLAFLLVALVLSCKSTKNSDISDGNSADTGPLPQEERRALAEKEADCLYQGKIWDVGANESGECRDLKQYCSLREKEGWIYVEHGPEDKPACIDKRTACLVKKGIYQDGTCITLQEDCLKKPGSIFDNETQVCVSLEEQCKRQSYHRKIEGGQCVLMGFMDLCQGRNKGQGSVDPKFVEQIKAREAEVDKTVFALRAWAKYSSTDGSQDSCLYTYDKLRDPKTTELDLSHLRADTGNDYRIKDLAPLREFTNLSELDLSNNRITGDDLAHIAGMKNLEILSLSNNKIEFVSTLDGLTKLKHLYLNNNQIVSLGGLKSLGLETLVVFGNQLRDFDEVLQLSNLVLIDGSQNPIQSVASLRAKLRLKKLELKDTTLVKMKQTEDNCPTLGTVGNPVTDEVSRFCKDLRSRNNSL